MYPRIERTKDDEIPALIEPEFCEDEIPDILQLRFFIRVWRTVLTRRQRTVLRRKFLDEHTWVDIGKHYNISKSRAQQIGLQAITKMRYFLDEEKSPARFDMVAFRKKLKEVNAL